MGKRIEDIEGIGPKTGAILREQGIKSVEALLDAGRDKKGRARLAAATNLSEPRILKAVNMADLFRIKGVASQYAELLEHAGVDTVKELKHRNAENLTAKMEEVNGARRLVRKTPSVKIVAAWIEQAQKLPGVISH